MKTKIMLVTILLLLIVNIVSLSKIHKYKTYYLATEELLDTLEEHYNWVDAIDFYTYYDAVESIDNK